MDKRGSKREWQVKLCDPLLTRAIPERFRDESLMIKHYTNLYFITYFYSPISTIVSEVL